VVRGPGERVGHDVSRSLVAIEVHFEEISGEMELADCLASRSYHRRTRLHRRKEK
jgi:hypothetical protein